MSAATINGLNEVDSSFKTVSPALRKSIENIIEKEKYVKYEIVIKNVDTLGNNFLGQLYQVDITGETVDGKNDLNIFVKEMVELEKFNLLPLAEAYVKEIFVYTELSKIFTQLQDQANVPKEDRYRIAKAYDETNTSTIILENLSKRGFQVYGKSESIPLKYVELAIQELAKFHVLSFVIEDKMPEYFNNKIKIREHQFNYDDDWRALMRNVCAHVAKVCGDEMRPRIEKFVPILLEKLPKYAYENSRVRCTFVHGDFKKNNVMVRLVDGEPVEVCAVDYQFTYYGCPMIDFMGFIHTSTDREFRKKHLNYLKGFYFERITRFLKYFDMDVEAVYPRREFEKVYSEWLDYGLMLALFTSVFAFAPDGGMDLANQTLSEIPFCPGKEYDHIYQGLISDFAEWGCL